MTDGPPASQAEGNPGSPPGGEPDFLAVGKLRRPHGVRGEILMDVYTDFPERIHPGVVLYVGEQYRMLHIRSMRWHKSAMLIAFEEFSDREQVGELRNQIVHVPTGDRPPLPQGEYYHHQLIGLSVVTESGNPLGVIKEILETGANDIFVVKTPASGDVLLPVIDEVVLDIDLDRGQIRVHLLPGLI
jgi:16S rRNA processing protein RimM